MSFRVWDARFADGTDPRLMQGRAIGVSALQCVGVQCRQLRVPTRHQLGGLDQHRLQPGIALLGNRTTSLFAGRRTEGCS
jgi:hypothetical protein